MKVGVISDIHGNHLALAEVLKSARKEGVGRFLVLGDLVGYYYHPDIVMDMLSGWPYDLIKGNHEVILQQLTEKRIDPQEVQQKFGHGHEQALKTLDAETLGRLFNLPVQKSVEIDGVSFQMNHGSPWNIDDYLYKDSGDEVLEKCNSENHDYVLVGHSHYSFSHPCRNSVLINCGSVGQSREKGGLAFWAVVDTAGKKFEIRATPYDSTAVQKEVRMFDPGFEYSLKILSR
jgi:predicted phosphodiesterase